MRASRLLQMLLLLQNRGRMTSARLAEELEVAKRTILRDVDALTEAGLPIIVFQGNQGGIELGFNYRTRLTGLSADEAEAMAVILSCPVPELDSLGLAEAGQRGRSKMLESFPDPVRQKIETARQRFRFENRRDYRVDPRVPALADAIRRSLTVRIRAFSADEQQIHPVSLSNDRSGWAVICDKTPKVPIFQADWGRINISSRRF